jgi:uroporphyrinogen-III synthase
MSKIKNILVTRPIQDEQSLTAKLQNLGYNVFRNPLLKIEFFSEISEPQKQILADENSIFLITSANSVRALANLTSKKDFKLLTIGQASKNEALKLGFENIGLITDDFEINSDVEGMIKYITKNYSFDQKLVHVSGEETFGNLTETLTGQGYKAEKINLYKTTAAEDFSNNILQNLKNNKIDLVILYSQKTALVFNDLCEKNNIKQVLTGLKILTLSPKITNLLIEKGWGNIGKIYNADKPDEAAIIQKLQSIKNIKPMENNLNSNPENNQNNLENKTTAVKTLNLWKFVIPFIFFMLSFVLMFQNFLLNKKIDKISESLEKSVVEGADKNQTKIEDLDKKITNTLLTLDSSALKDNKERLDEIKGLLQDIRGLGFEGNVSQADVASVDAASSEIAANTISVPSLDSKVIEVTNVEYYSSELDKIKTAIENNDKEYEVLKTDLYNISEKLIAEYNAKNPPPAEVANQDKSILSGMVKITKINEVEESDFVEKVKSAAIYFENGDYSEVVKTLEDINIEAKNVELNDFVNKLKKFDASALDMKEIVSKLDAIVKGLKEIAK